MVIVNLQSLPVASRALSITLPSVVISMFPPQSTTATFLPLISGTKSDIINPNPAAPAPSTTAFSDSSRRRMAIAIQSSSIETTLSNAKVYCK